MCPLDLGSHLQCQSCVSRRKTGRLLLAVQSHAPTHHTHHTPHVDASRLQSTVLSGAALPLLPRQYTTPAPAHARACAHWRTKNRSQPQRPQCPHPGISCSPRPAPPEWDRWDLADIVSSSGRAGSPLPSRAEQAGHTCLEAKATRPRWLKRQVRHLRSSFRPQGAGHEPEPEPQRHVGDVRRRDAECFDAWGVRFQTTKRRHPRYLVPHCRIVPAR